MALARVNVFPYSHTHESQYFHFRNTLHVMISFLLEFCRGSRGFPGFRGNEPKSAGKTLRNTRAGGQDDVSLNKLPQMKQLVVIDGFNDIPLVCAFWYVPFYLRQDNTASIETHASSLLPNVG